MKLKERYAIYCDNVDPKEKLLFHGWYGQVTYNGKTDEQMYTHKKPVSQRIIAYKEYCERVPEYNRMTMQGWLTVMSRDGLGYEDMYTYVMMKNKPQAVMGREYQERCKELGLVPFNHNGFLVYYAKGKDLDWIIQHTKDKPDIYRYEYPTPKKYQEISIGEKLRLKRLELGHVITN